MSFKSASIAAAVAMTLWSASADARELTDMFTLRGYGTAGLVYSDEDRADFVSTMHVQPEGAGYSDDVSMVVDSKNALQLDMTLTDRFSGVVQIISEGVNNNTWDGDPNKRFHPSLEWANLSYRLTDEVTVRAGRIVSPFFMSSEYRKVGFASHWVRPPVEVYGAQPYTSSDGGDITYRTKLGAATNTLRTHYGKQALRTETFKAGVEVWGVNDGVEIGALTLRAAYLNIKFATTEDQMGPLFSMFVQGAGAVPGAEAAVAEARRLQDVYNPYLGQGLEQYAVGVSYDPGNWFVMAEMVESASDGLVLDTTSGYVSGGYRLNKLTPYATYSRTKSHTRNERGIPTAGLPLPLAGLAGVIDTTIDGLVQDQISSQQTVAVGVRWDFASSLALKAQYDYVDLERDSLGMLVNQQADFERGSNVNVLSIALDFVF
jgi:predicted porin